MAFERLSKERNTGLYQRKVKGFFRPYGEREDPLFLF